MIWHINELIYRIMTSKKNIIIYTIYIPYNFFYFYSWINTINSHLCPSPQLQVLIRGLQKGYTFYPGWLHPFICKATPFEAKGVARYKQCLSYKTIKKFILHIFIHHSSNKARFKPHWELVLYKELRVCRQGINFLSTNS